MRIKVVVLLAVGLASGSLVVNLNANPLGGSVVGGDANATIHGEGSSLVTINQNRDRAIINWNTFSIGVGETTKFLQPSATASILNRVMSSNPSLLYGNLQANGRVFLVNPAGVLVGPSGVINTRGFLASTFDIGNDAFRSAARLTLAGPSTAAVRNEGTITALGGDVFLIAHEVENTGAIEASGTVGLAAGSRVLLTQAGAERISVQAGNSAQAGRGTGVNNQGNIQAASAELKAASGNMYALAINNGGAIRASTVQREGGKVYIRAAGGNIENSGSISASGTKGNGGTVVVDAGHLAGAPATVTSTGTIEARGEGAGSKGGAVRLLGDRVGLFDNASVDVSGRSGGGTALLGGSFQGADPAIRNAQQTYLAPGVRVTADALGYGNGGRVVVWSDDATRFYGNISVRGGAFGGNGGAVEVSSHNFLDFNGHVDATAPHGAFGTLLLDPRNLTIAATNNAGTNPTGFGDPANGTDSTVGDQVISGALDSADVTLFANNNISLDVGATIAPASGTHSLTMDAGNSISFGANSSVVLRGGASGGSFTAIINDSASDNANRTAGAATFTMGSGSSITAPGGITIAPDHTGPAAGAFGNISLTTLSTRSSNPASRDAGSISVDNSFDGGHNITISGTINASGLDATSSGADGGNGGNVTLNAGAGGSLSVAAITANGGSFSGSGGGHGGNAGTIALTGGTGITLNNNISSIHGNGAVPNGTDGNQTYNGAVSLGGDATLSGGTLAFSSTIDGAHNLTITNLASAGGPTFGGAIGTIPLLSLAINSDAAVQLNQNIKAGSVAVWSGMDGGGNLTFSAGVQVNADSQSYRAGSGSGSTALVDFSGNPTLRNSGSAAPVSFSYRQDANIGNTAIPAASLFGGTVPATYSIRSDGGTLELSDPTKVAGSILTLAAGSTLTISGALSGANSLVSLNASGNGIVFNAAGTPANPTVQTSAGQTYSGPVSLSAATVLKDTGGNDLVLNSGVNGGQTLLLDTTANVGLGAVGTSTRLTGLTVKANQLFLNGNISTEDGPVDFTGVTGVRIVSSLTIDTDGTQNAGAAGAITFGPATTIDGQSAGQSLTLDARGQGTDASGNVALGVVGGTTRLSGLTVGANTLTLNGNISTEDGTVNFTEVKAVTLANNITIDTDSAQNGGAAGAINFGGGTAINGDALGRTLTLDASGQGTDASGDVALGVVGGTTRLGSLTAKASTLTLNGNISTEGGPVDFTGASAVLLADNITIDTDATQDGAAAGAITFGTGASINGLTATEVLTLDASGQGTDASGNVALGVVGGTTRVGGLTVKANTVTLNGNISTEGGAVDMTGVAAVNLANAVTIDTDGTQDTVAAGAISFGTTTAINGNSTLVLDAMGQGTDAAGNINLGLIGTTTPLLAGLTARGATLMLNGAIEINHAGTVSLESVNDIPINANITAGTLNAHSGADGSGNISFGIGVTIRADTQSYQAGDGPAGGGTAATVDLLNNTPAFRNTAGLAQPLGFTDRQDAAITGANLPAAAQFGGTYPGALTLRADDGGVALPALTLPGSLQVIANGDITQSGALNLVAGSSTFTIEAGTWDILLNTFANHFDAQPVTISTVSGGSVRDLGFRNVDAAAASPVLPANLRNLALEFNAAAITLPGLTVGGTLSVIAGGNIGQTGPLNVTGGASTFTIDTVTANVNLGGQANHFGNQLVTVSAINGGTVQDVSLRNADANAVGPVLPATLHDLTLQYDAAGINLPTLNLTGNLQVTAGGLVDFVGAGASTIGGSMDLTTTAGGINDSGAGTLTVTGPSTLAAGVANNITLDNNNNFSSVNVLSGNNVTLSDSGAINLASLAVSGDLKVNAAGLVDFTGLGASTVGGLLTITTTAGGINDSGSGSLTVGGNSTLSAGAANNIRLDNNNNNFNTVSVLSANDVALRDSGAINLGDLAVSGNLNVNAGGLVDFTGAGLSSVAGAMSLVTTAGGINDSGAGNLIVTGPSALAAGAGNNITLNNNDDFSSVIVASGQDVTLRDVNAINLGNLNVGGNLNVNAGGLLDFVGAGASTVGGTLSLATTAGGINDSGLGSLTVASFTTLNAGAANNITLDNNNDFAARVSISSGKDVRLNDVNALPLGNLTVSGNLNLTAAGLVDFQGSAASTVAGAVTIASTTGGISDSGSGNLTATGPTTLTVGAANDISLNNNNDFSSVTIVSGHNVTLNDRNALAVGGVVSGNLALTSAGTLSDTTAGLAVLGTTTLAAGSADINFSQANDFGGDVSVASGHNVVLNDLNSIQLGASTISGSLGVKAKGAITESGALSVIAGPSTFTIDAVTADVLLGTAPNHFANQVVLLNAINGGAIRDLSFRNVDANAVAPVLPLGLRSLTLQLDAAPIALPALTLSGNLSVTAGGLISDLGALSIAGTTTLAAGSTHDINLIQADDFGGAVNIISGHNVTLRDLTGLTVGGNVTADLATTTVGPTAFNALTVGGNLNSIAGGPMTQNAPLNIGGLASLTSSGLGVNGNITLNDAANQFGSLALNSANGQAVSVSEANGTVLDTVAVNNGSLSVLSAGPITQVAGKAINVSGLASFTSTGTGANGDVTLNNAGNNFGSLGLQTANGQAVSVTEASATALDTVAVNNGTLAIHSGGDITQLAGKTVTVDTTSTLDAAGNITLSTAGNDFGGLVTVVNGQAVTLVDANALDVAGTSQSLDARASAGNLTLAGYTTTGSLAARASADILQTAPLSVGTTASLNAGGNISLNNVANDFAGLVTVLNGQTVNLVDANSLSVGGASSSLSAQARGGTLNLAGYATTGALAAQASADIAQSGAVTVGTTANLNAGGNINLNNAGNDFVGLVTVANGQAVNLVDANALNVSGSSVSLSARANGGALNLAGYSTTGALTAQASTDVTQSGVVSVGTTTSLGAGGNVTLNNPANDFAGLVTVANGQTVDLADVNSLTVGGASQNLGADAKGGNLTLAGYTTTGTLAAKSSADVLQTGPVVVGGTASLDAAGNITLNNGANDFVGLVTVVNGQTVNLVDANNLNVAGASGSLSAQAVAGALNLAGYTTTGSLAAQAGADITQSGVLTVGTTANLNAGGNVTLNNAANDFVGLVTVANGQAVSLVDANSLNVAGSSASLSAQANGGPLNLAGYTTTGALVGQASTDITQSAAVTAGSANLNAGGNITLNNAANDFVGLVTVANGQTVDLVDANSLNVGGSSASLSAKANGGTLNLAGYTTTANLTAQASADITQSGAVTVGTTANLNAGGNITLNNAANDFVGLVTVANGQAVTLADANSLNVAGSSASLSGQANGGTLNLAGYTTTGALAAQASTDITQSAAVTAGSATLNAGGNITLNNAANDFVGLVTVANGQTVDLVDANSLNVGGSSASLSAKADGGTLNLAGYTTAANLVAQASGDITQSAAVRVGTTANLNAGGNVTLNNAANDFAGLVTLANGQAVSLVDVNNLDVTGSSGSLSAQANGGTLNLAGYTTAGNLAGQASGDITQSAPLSVGGIADLAAGGNISLTDAGNDFDTVRIATANNALLTDINAIDLGVSAVTAHLGVLAGRAISQSGAVTVGGLATFTSTGSGAAGNITLENSGNNFGSVSLNSADGSAVSLAEGSGTALDTVAVNSGTLAVDSAGAITQIGGKSVKVGGLASFTSTGAGAAGNITLGENGNNFGSLALHTDNGLAVSVNESSSTLLENVAAPNATFALQSSGAISQDAGTTINTRELAVQSPTSIILTNGNDIQNLAGNLTGTGTFEFTDVSGLTVTTVNGISGSMAGITAVAPGSTVTLNANQIGITSSGITAARNLVALQPLAGGGTLFIGGPYAGPMGPLSFSGLNNVKAGTLQVGNSSTFAGNIVVAQSISLTNVSSGPFQPVPGGGTSTSDSTALSLQTRAGTITNMFSGGSWAVMTVPRLSLVASNAVILGNLANSSDVTFLAWYSGHPIKFVDANTLDLLWRNPAFIGVNHPPIPNPAGAGLPNTADYLPIDNVFGPIPISGNDILFNGGGVPAQQFANSLAPFNSIELPMTRLALSGVTTDFDLKAYGAKIDSILGPGSIWMTFAAIPFEKETPWEERARPEFTSKWVRGYQGISGSTAGPQQGPF